MKAFKYSSSQQPIIRVAEMETPHHYTYHHPREGGSSTTTTAAIEESELSIFDAQKYFNETNESPNPELETSAALQSSPSPPPPPPPPTTTYNPPFHDLPASLPRRLSSSASSSAAYSYGTKGHRDSGGSGVRCFSFPTASSEASWNSQTGLLTNPPGSVPVQLRNFHSSSDGRKRGSSSSWFFRLRCPCAGKKSLPVEGGEKPASAVGNVYAYPKRQNQNTEVEKVSVIPRTITTHKETAVPVPRFSEAVNHNPLPLNIMHHRQQRLSASGNAFPDANSVAFSFPILNQTFPAVVPPKMDVLRRAALPLLSAVNDPPRESLEVFQPQANSVPSNSLLFSSHGAGGRGIPFLGSPTKAARDDDALSDASSDLFEIESFSTQQTSSTYSMYYYQRRDSLEEATTFNARQRFVAATSGGGGNIGSSFCRRSIDEEVINESEYCYEPSEASIDWSVTTAEGFDRASMTNYSIATMDMEEPPIARREREVRGGGMEGGKGTRSSKTKGMGLLSCRHESAVVSVGPKPVKCTAEEGQAVAVGPPHSFQFMSTLRHVGGRAGNNPSKPPLVGTSTAHSNRLSLAFAA